jgi:hypothetical protein
MTSLRTVNTTAETVAGAAVRWRYRFGPTDAESVLGVNVTRISDGRVIEQLGYTKTPGEPLPLPDLPATTAPTA